MHLAEHELHVRKTVCGGVVEGTGRQHTYAES